MLEVARLAGLTFKIDTVLNARSEIYRLFGGRPGQWVVLAEDDTEERAEARADVVALVDAVPFLLNIRLIAPLSLLLKASVNAVPEVISTLVVSVSV